MKRSAPHSPLPQLFAALSDPTRLRLLNLIAGQEVCVCYFVAILKQPQPKISRQLAYLRQAGLVQARREGKWMHYSLQRPGDPASSVLDAALAALRQSKHMQADSAKLRGACCEPQRLVTLQSAPKPVAMKRTVLRRSR